jgi:tetratricopeptide (TPR) repeat protein/transcriptional regulator with XRE-family HTH domain
MCRSGPVIIEASKRPLAGHFQEEPMAIGSEFPVPLALLVRTWRERALLTQEQLARRTGLGVRTIRRLESGDPRRPRSQSVRLLADALGLTDAERALLIAAAQDGREQSRAVDPAGTPRQLPADVTGFAGRAAQLRQLDSLLPGEPGAPAAVVISAIAGSAGVGKTALAVHWARRVADQFPDGQLYVNLHGFSPAAAPARPATVLRGFLEALDVPPARVPADVDAQAALYRSRLAGRRMLVVLDNAADDEQVRPLLPGAPGCLTVVTSRSQLTGLVATEHAHALAVDVLSTEEARELLGRRLGAQAIAADAAAIDDIAARCARLPLALAVVAARAATQAIPLPELAAELRDARRRLDPFDTGDARSDLRAVFSWSYKRLGAGAARLYPLLGLHPGPDVTVAAAASLAGISTTDAAAHLEELTRAHLVMEHVPGRFTFHDLLRAFAVELVHRTHGDAERDGTRHRLLDHYLHTAYAAATLLHPLRRRFTPAEPQPGVEPEALSGEESALGWFAAERIVLIAAVHAAVAAGYDRHAYQLAWCMTDYLDWRGHWHDWATTQRAALRAAERLGDPVAQVLAHRGLAGASARQGDYDGSLTHLNRALELLDGAGSTADRAQIHLNLGTVNGRQQRHADAVRHDLQALELYRTAGDRAGEGDALGAVGWSYSLLGKHELAVNYCRQALAVHRELDNREGEAASLDSLGHAYHHLGRYSRAIACYQRAIELSRTLKNRYYEAFSLHHLGDTHRAAGEPEAAREQWLLAMEILDELGHSEAAQLRTKLDGLEA